MVNFFEQVFIEPHLFEVILEELPDEDLNGNISYHRTAYIYKKDDSQFKYHRVDDEQDIENILKLKTITLINNLNERNS